MERNQLIFLVVVGIVIFYQSLRGWRLGPVRQLLRIIAIAGAYAAAYFGSAATVSVLHPLGFPNIVLQGIGGIALGIVTYLAVSLLAGILFKKTTDQTSTLIWFIYGVTGSLIGIACGAVLVMGAAILIRLLGTLAEGSIPKLVATAMTTGQTPGDQAEAPKSEARSNSTISSLVVMKRYLDESPAGGVLQTLDPVPKQFYETIGKIGKMSSNQDAMNRFIEFPDAKKLAQDPAIANLREDPEIARCIATHNYVALLKNARLVKVANDPRIGGMLKKFEFEKALNYALQ